MKPLTIKLLVGAGVLGLYYLTREGTASAADQAPAPAPGPFPAPVPVPAPIPRGIPDRVNPEVFPVDQFSGRYVPQPRRYGWPWF